MQTQSNILSRRLFAAVLLLFAVVASVQSLHAHATLLHSLPAPSERLGSAPGQIELAFNERIESVFHSLRVVSAQGREVETADARVADGGETLIVALPALAQGPYAVYWRVNSLDGHQVQGQFGFGVDAEPPSEAELLAWRPVAAQHVPDWYFPLVKGLGLLSLAIAMGGLGAGLLGGLDAAVEGTALEAEREIHRQFLARAQRAALFAAAGYLFMEIAALVGKTAAFAGGPLSSALKLSVVQATLRGSSYGQWWAIRFAAAVALLLVLLILKPIGKPRPLTQLAGWLMATVIATTVAVTGHAQAAVSNTWLAELAGGAHLAASLIWAGGLFHLARGVALATESPDGDDAALKWLSGIAPRFSRLAQSSVALILLTGVYNTWLHVPGWSAFVTTAYGRVLLGKLFWVLLTMGIAFINWQRVLPELARWRQGLAGTGRWVPRFQPLLQSELACCIVIFAMVGLLTNMAPASADPAAGARELSKKAGDVEVALRLDPGRLGSNRALIHLLDVAGEPLTDARKVMIYLRSLDMDMGLTTAEARPQPDGSFAADAMFSMAGRWRVSVEVTPARGDAFIVDFDVTI